MRNSSGIGKLIAVVVLVFSVCGAYAALAQTPAAKTPQKSTPTQSTASKAQEKPALDAPKEVTLKGEVVDLHCYMMDPTKAAGPEHAACIRKGFPAGFVSNGQLYLILGRGMEPAKDVVADMAGVKTELTGQLYEHGGVKAVELVKIQKTVG